MTSDHPTRFLMAKENDTSCNGGIFHIKDATTQRCVLRRFSTKALRADGPTDEPTDPRTERPRDAPSRRHARRRGSIRSDDHMDKRRTCGTHLGNLKQLAPAVFFHTYYIQTDGRTEIILCPIGHQTGWVKQHPDPGG